MSEPMTQAEYLDCNGSVCPCCKSDSINGGAMSFYGEVMTQEVECSACNAEWEDEYKLTGYRLAPEGH